MGNIGISQLEQYSGLKAHTIRVWEQRHKLLRPRRTVGNRRLYTVDDVELMLDLALLNKHGFNVSRLAKLTRPQIKSHVLALGFSFDVSVARAKTSLIVLYLNENISGFENQIDLFIETNGAWATVEKLILPFIKQIGLLFYFDQSPKTHLAVTVIRKKLLYASQTVPTSSSVSNTVLLFLLENQHFDLVLLYISYMLQCQSIRVIYLGTNINFQSLQHAIMRYEPDILVTYVPPLQTLDIRSLQFLANTTDNLVITSSSNRQITPAINLVDFTNVVQLISARIQS